MHGANGSNGRMPVNRLPKISTEGFGEVPKVINEAHEESAGHVIHSFTPELAARIPEHPAATAFPNTPWPYQTLGISIRGERAAAPSRPLEDQLLDGRCRVKACCNLSRNVLAVHYSLQDLGTYAASMGRPSKSISV